MPENNHDFIFIKVDPDLEDLIPMFLENRSDDITTIKESLKDNDFEKIQSIGHSMKGSGGGYGFDEITEIGSHLEQSAKNKDPENIIKLTLKLEEYLKKIKVVFE